jgi:hypothetical protein
MTQTTKTRAEVEARLALFVAAVTEYVNQQNQNADIYSYVFTVERGAKNARIVRAEQWGDKEPTSRCVYCFVRLEDGAILKGSWKAPVKNPERGNIFNENFDIGEGRALNMHSCAYLH